MPGSDFSVLQSALDALAVQATSTVGVEDSAEVVINGQGAATDEAVQKALADFGGVDAAAIQAASDAVKQVTQVYADSAAKLGTAISTNPNPGAPVQPVIHT